MSEELIFIEANCTLSTCAIIVIDHYEMMFIHFTKVTKYLKKKNKYKSLIGKVIHVICYLKQHSKKTS